MRITQDRFDGLMLKTCAFAFHIARREQNQGEDFLNRRIREPGELSQEELLAILQDFQSGKRSSKFHLGDPQMIPDVVVHSEIEAFVKKFWPPGTIVGGEEMFERNAVALKNAADGTLALNTDPIDGTRLFRTLRFGWCVALQLLIKVGDEWRHERAILAGSDGLYIAADRDWMVCSGELAFNQYPSEEEILTHLGNRNTLRAPSLAVVAAKAFDFLKFMPLLNEVHMAGWDADTVGGNPIALSFAKGDLCASVTVTASTTWDTIWVPIVTSLGAVATTLEGEPIPIRVIREWYNSIGFGEDALTVPPVVIARREVLEELLDLIRKSNLPEWVAKEADEDETDVIDWIQSHRRDIAEPESDEINRGENRDDSCSDADSERHRGAVTSTDQS